MTHIEPSKKSVITMDNGTTIGSVVYTNPQFAKRIIDYFEPKLSNYGGIYLDPCKGDGAFYNNFPKGCKKDWCEIQQGRDFYDYQKKGDIKAIFANPQWQGKYYAPFVKRCYELSDNVIILAKLFGVLGTQRRLRDIHNAGFGIKEIILCDWKDADFKYIDGTSKLAEGFLLSIVHMQKNWTAGTHWNFDWSVMKNQTDVKQWKKDSEYVKSKNGNLAKRFSL